MTAGRRRQVKNAPGIRQECLIPGALSLTASDDAVSRQYPDALSVLSRGNTVLTANRAEAPAGAAHAEMFAVHAAEIR